MVGLIAVVIVGRRHGLRPRRPATSSTLSTVCSVISKARRRSPIGGAAAVEMALVLPLLLLLVFGIVDFGRALNLQITLTQAAREGVRPAALGSRRPR